MPRENDRDRKLQRTGPQQTNPTQQLAQASSQRETGRTGECPPPPPMAGQQSNSPAASPSVHEQQTTPPRHVQNQSPEIPSTPDLDNLPEVNAPSAASPDLPPPPVTSASMATAALSAGLPGAPVNLGMQQPGLQQTSAVQSLVRNLLDTRRLADQKFYLVIVPDDSHPRVEEFDTIADLLDEIREHLGTPTSLFPFMGHHMGISKGPNRFLGTPYGSVPLFVVPDADDLEFEDNGYVGEDNELSAPTTESEDEYDDYEEDDDDEHQQSPSPSAPALTHDEQSSPVLPDS